MKGDCVMSDLLERKRRANAVEAALDSAIAALRAAVGSVGAS